jgi:hypothetical protein
MSPLDSGELWFGAAARVTAPAEHVNFLFKQRDRLKFKRKRRPNRTSRTGSK